MYDMHQPTRHMIGEAKVGGAKDAPLTPNSRERKKEAYRK